MQFPFPSSVVLSRLNSSLARACGLCSGSRHWRLAHRLLRKRLSDEQRHDEGEVWFAGTAWGLAFLLKNHTADMSSEVNVALWQRFRETAGNMLHVLSEDAASIARFFSLYPAAASCLAIWKLSPRELSP